jgi:urea transport system substrate-binding protein
MPATLKYARPYSVPTSESSLWLLACLISCCLTCTVGCDSQEKKFLDWLAPRKEPQKIKLGILHSQTGTMGLSEMSLRHAEILAIEEINASGDFPDVEFEAIVKDGRSRQDIFRRRTRDLIDREHVDVIFGCWTSSDRKAVIDEIQNPTSIYVLGNYASSQQPLLFYPLQYEGAESHRNVFYFGSTPNQQILPAIDYFLDEQGGNKKRIFLLGSDYLYPKTANYIVKKYLQLKGLEAVGEAYVPLGHRDFKATLEAIQTASPDLILNTINGDSNIHFFNAFKTIFPDPNTLPILSTSVGEDELRRLPPDVVQGHYAAWSYFQSIDSPANRQFVSKVKKAYGYDRVTDDPMEAAYLQVHLWKEAYRRAKSSEPDKIRQELEKGIEFDAPSGKVKVDPKTHHLYKRFRLGKIRSDRQFDLVYESKDWIAPDPFPSFAFPGWSCDWTRGGLLKGPPPAID